MHELSIAMSIVDLIQEQLQARGTAQVTAIHIQVGALSGVSKDALLTSYEVATQQTPLEGSQLIVEEMPVLVNCPRCLERRAVPSIQWLCCAVCGTPASEIVQGHELMVTGMEVLE